VLFTPAVPPQALGTSFARPDDPPSPDAFNHEQPASCSCSARTSASRSGTSWPWPGGLAGLALRESYLAAKERANQRREGGETGWPPPDRGRHPTQEAGPHHIHGLPAALRVPSAHDHRRQRPWPSRRRTRL